MFNPWTELQGRPMKSASGSNRVCNFKSGSCFALVKFNCTLLGTFTITYHFSKLGISSLAVTQAEQKWFHSDYFYYSLTADISNQLSSPMVVRKKEMIS